MKISSALLQSTIRIIDHGLGESQHPNTPVMAVIILQNGDIISSVNFLPDSISQTFGTKARIGNRSGYIHAEVAALTKCYNHCAHGTHGASIVISDPPCMDCALAIGLAGISNVFIHPSGFKRNFAKHAPKSDLETCGKILEFFGINLFLIVEKSAGIYTIPINQLSKLITIKDAYQFDYRRIKTSNDLGKIQRVATYLGYNGRGLAENAWGDLYVALARDITGFPFGHHKYDLSPNSLAVLMGGCQSHGLRLVDGMIFVDNSKRPIPTRTLLDFYAAGHGRLHATTPPEHELTRSGLIHCVPINPNGFMLSM